MPSLSEGQFQGKIYRGEVRRVYPTPEHPDPASADPHELLQHWTQPNYPYPKNYRGFGLSVGQHWTRSPEIMPHRFVEPVLLGKQPGVPMGQREQRAVSAQDFSQTDAPEGVSWHEHYPAVQAAEKSVKRYERQGVNVFRDLSGGDPDLPGAAKPFHMGVVWEAHHPERSETGTNYEDELNLPHQSHVEITGARIFVPKSGTTPNLRERHPTTFTHQERAAARSDVIMRSTYSHIGEHTSVPWSRVQFQEPVKMEVKHHQSLGQWGR